MSRSRLLALSLLVCLPCVGCGSAKNQEALDIVGPAAAIPFAPGAGESMTVNLKNVAGEDAPVTLTAYDPFGVTVPGFGGTVLVPAHGEVRVGVVGVVADGWIHVETRDALTLADLSTTGLVIPSFRVERAGPAVEAAPASDLVDIVALVGGVGVPVTEHTQAVQVINDTRSAAVPTTPVPLAATVTIYDTAGAVFSSTPVVLAANEVYFPLLPAGFTGSVVVTAADDGTKLESVAVAARETPSTQSLAYDEADLEGALGRSWVFGVDWGQESSGDFLDFAIVVTNLGDTPSGFTIDAIRTEGGGDVLPAPRGISLGAHETRYYATTVVDSRGLDVGEVHAFADLYGDVFTTSVVSRQWWVVTPGENIHLCVRNFEPAFFEAHTTVRPVDLAHSAIAEVIEQETSTLSGQRNWLTLVNPATGPLTIFVRAFTPGGAAYDLPDLVVPARNRFDWSPDGIVLNGLVGIRENQNDPSATPVDSFSLQFSSAGSFGLLGRRDFRDGLDRLVARMPITTTPLD